MTDVMQANWLRASGRSPEAIAILRELEPSGRAKQDFRPSFQLAVAPYFWLALA